MLFHKYYVFLYQLFKQIHKEMPFFVYGISFYGLAIIAPSNKLLLVITLLFLGVLILFLRNIYEALFFCYVLAKPILVGKSYHISLVPSAVLDTGLYPNGRNLVLIFEISDVILFIMFWLFAFTLIKRIFSAQAEKINIPSSLVVLIFYLIVSSITLFYSMSVPISLYFYIKMIKEPLVILFVIYFLQKKKKLISSFVECLLATLTLESILGIMQFLKKGPLGLAIEIQSVNALFGGGADESYLFRRPFGTFSHANPLGYQLAAMVFFVIGAGTLVRQTKIRTQLTSIIVGLGTITLMLTFSRSAWLAFCFGGLVLIRNIKVRRYVQKVFGFLYAYRYLLGVLFIFSISIRLSQTMRSFGFGGGWETRMIMINESLALIKENPLFGTGFGTNIIAVYRSNPMGNIRNFPEPVHNGYILTIAEQGFLLSLLILIFYWLLHSNLTYHDNEKKYLPIMESITLGTFVIALFMPDYIINDLVLLMFTPLLAFLTSKKQHIYVNEKNIKEL